MIVTAYYGLGPEKVPYADEEIDAVMRDHGGTLLRRTMHMHGDRGVTYDVPDDQTLACADILDRKFLVAVGVMFHRRAIGGG